MLCVVKGEPGGGGGCFGEQKFQGYDQVVCILCIHKKGISKCGWQESLLHVQLHIRLCLQGLGYHE